MIKSTTKFIDELKDLFYLGLSFYFPFFILLFLGYSIIDYEWSYFKEVLAFGIMNSVFMLLFLTVKKKRYRLFFMCFFSVLLYILVITKLFFYQLYGVKIGGSALYVIFETNQSEAVDYFSDFVNNSIIVILMLIILSLDIVLRFFFFPKKIDNLISRIPVLCFKNLFLKFSVVILAFTGSYVVVKKFYRENIMIETFNAYQEYIAFKKLLKNNLSKPESKYLKNVKAAKSPQTFIVVIGESTSRAHMQLYGYNRETNPELNKIKKELYIFDDVIAPHVHTISSLEKILTLSNNSDPDKKENSSIIQLANQAGFTSYWLSNQKPLGFSESIPTLIGNGANQKYFINSNDYNYDVYDESLLPYLDSILKEPVQKKLVFIHLMGTHGVYDKRYPKEFNYFTDNSPLVKFKHKEAYKKTNAYDNAVRYNDFIIRTIIEKVRNQNTQSYVMYFSDHGDEVYDTIDFLGHNEYHGSKSMYEVPFIVWMSDSYKKAISKEWHKSIRIHRKYNLEDFIHSFAQISSIDFDSYDATRSIFEKKFQDRKRIVKINVDYDKK